MAADRRVADRIRFLGPVDGEDRSALLTRCALLAMPSTSENFGNSLLEAMAAGMPILEAYGMTEATAVTHVNTLESARLGTVGRLLSGLEQKLADEAAVIRFDM